MKLIDIDLSNLPKVQKFMSGAVRENYVVTREKYFKWQFLDSGNIWGSKDDTGPLAIINENEVKGVSLTSKCPIYIDGKTINGAWHHDWYLDQDSSGRGVYLILEHFRRNEFLGSAGQSLYAANVAGRLRKMCWFNLHRLFTVIDLKKTNDLLIKSDEQSLPYLEYCMLDNKRYDNCIFEFIDSFDDKYDNIWLKIRNKFILSTDRTSEYMNWRYIDHPIFDYKVVLCQTDFGDVYWVWREEIVEEKNMKVARICEIIGNEETINMSFNQIYFILKDSGVAFADFFCSNQGLVNSLIDAGMKNVITLPEFDLPRYYSPYSDSFRKTINFSYWLSDNLFNKNYFHTNNTYITKGDVNQDRPNH